MVVQLVIPSTRDCLSQGKHVLRSMFFVYMIESAVDNSFYIGQTKDLIKRVQYHNEGLSKYTSKKIPWKLVYTEEFNTRTEAIKRERFLKNQKNRTFYKRLIQNWSGSSVG
ncbi:GIY-YIG nuclease family protein [uncultured Eudoraea sp.]|uniref:GIY-YIG nuclease family protein n=1 Tax=uncultured Eudoraea sp. TaxID=1035614 RepID=UPI0026021D1A|nr:GIY-YIG nuclease family protein [uncultured Eudoraea sp.]